MSDARDWSSPIPGASPAGEDTRYDDAHATLRGQIAQLENPAGDPVDWDAVLRGSEALLTTRSKDITLASYATAALLEASGIEGLRQGLAAQRAMMETFWEDAFPPKKRARSRGAALSWLTELATERLEALSPQPVDRDALVALEAEVKALRAFAQEKLEDNAPATGPLQEIITRHLLTLGDAPAGSEVAGGSSVRSAAAQSPKTAGSVGGDTAESKETQSPETQSTQAATQAKPAELSPSQANAAAVNTAEASESTGQEAQNTREITTSSDSDPRIAIWLAPISAESPGGDDLRYDTEVEALREEVGKLDSPSATDPVDWDRVYTGAEAILKARSKDWLIASHLALSLFEREGLAGIAPGMLLLAGFAEHCWEHSFPPAKRLRGRAGAIAHYLGILASRIDAITGGAKVPPNHRALQASDAAPLAQAEAALKTLSAALRSRMPEHAPATGQLKDNLTRLSLSLPQAEKPADKSTNKQANATAQDAPTSPTSAQSPTAATRSDAHKSATPTSSEASAHVSLGQKAADAPGLTLEAAGDDLDAFDKALSQNAEYKRFLTGTGNALWQTAQDLKKAAPLHAEAFRLRRIAIYDTLTQLPPADGSHKTTLPPPSSDLRTQLETLFANQKWAALLEESESALRRNRFFFALHRYSAIAAASQGAPHTVQQTLTATFAALTKRFPELSELCFSDGTPFIDPDTRAYFADAFGAPSGATLGQNADEAQGSIAHTTNDVMGLWHSGKQAEAVEALGAALEEAKSGRRRFLLRHLLGTLFEQAGKLDFAQAIYSGLLEEAARYNLPAWDPELEARIVKSAHATLQKLKDKGRREISREEQVVYQRLCYVDPVSAWKAK